MEVVEVAIVLEFEVFARAAQTRGTGSAGGAPLTRRVESPSRLRNGSGDNEACAAATRYSVATKNPNV